MGAEPGGRAPGGSAAPRLGLDIGGTKLLGVLVDARGELVRELQSPTGRGRGPEGVLETCVELVERLREGQPEAAGLGVGFAGLVDREAGIVRSSVILPGWDGVRLVDRMEAALGLPVVLDNDATAAGWGEYVALGRQPGGAGKPRRGELLVLTVGTGIGGALFLGGRLQRGARGLAGEVGHMVVDREGAPCLCGRRGCLHTLASGTALTEAAARLAEREPGWALARGGAAPTLEQVGKAAAAGDEAALQLVRAGGEALGVGIANLAQLLDPARVALCGGVVGLGEPWLEAVRRSVQREVFAEVWEGLEIAPALLGSRSGAYGAAQLVEPVG